MSILEKIVLQKRLEVDRQKEAVGLKELLALEQMKRTTVSFRQALSNSHSGIIAEFKRKSPSKGWIYPGASPEDVVTAYEQSGATAVSVLTDPEFFGGMLSDLSKVRPLVSLPLLRKDFIIDSYQIYQSKVMGADFVLLIAAALSPATVKAFAALAKELGLEVLLEIHTEQELECICDDVDVVGINNRNLKTFVTDVQTSFDLGSRIPRRFMKISESGLSDPIVVKELRSAGFSGFLMGENFMKEKEPGAALNNFIRQL
ncbi:MAG: indole-3-glycerol phosphate synthase TrpC [Bacteroidales bacterium]|nr:indole-3-glycerol phosphate synthase TrpC [Bacteroidales bacterium]